MPVAPATKGDPRNANSGGRVRRVRNGCGISLEPRARGFGVRVGRLRRRPHAYGRRRARRRRVRSRHGLHRLQRLDVPELHRDSLRTGRLLAALEHEFQRPVRAHRARIQRHEPEFSVRPAPQFPEAGIPAHGRRHSQVQPARPGIARGGRRRDHARRLSGSRGILAVLHRSLHHSDGCGDLVLPPHRHAAFPGAVLHRILRKPRLPERR